MKRWFDARAKPTREVLAQLTQLVQTFTTLTAVQNIVQALIIGVGIVAQLQLGGSSSRLTGLVRKRSTP
mgnify:CR=1 FL=1